MSRDSVGKGKERCISRRGKQNVAVVVVVVEETAMGTQNVDEETAVSASIDWITA
jgi:hypothetical protein